MMTDILTSRTEPGGDPLAAPDSVSAAVVN